MLACKDCTHRECNLARSHQPRLRCGSRWYTRDERLLTFSPKLSIVKTTRNNPREQDPLACRKGSWAIHRITRSGAWPLQRPRTRTSGKHKLFDIRKNRHVKIYIPNLFTFPHLPPLLHAEGLVSWLPTGRGVHLLTHQLRPNWCFRENGNKFN